LVLQVDFDRRQSPSGFSSDGKYLIYTVVDPQTRGDIWYLPWSDNPDWSDGVEFLATSAIESQGQVSPDGRWIAYTSDESDNIGVYIRSFPSGSSGWKVSVGIARDPRWNADGSELFFLGPRPGQTSMANGPSLLAAGIQPNKSGGLRIGIPQGNIWSYAPHPDGQRFLVNQSIDPGQPTINVITNWRPAPGE
jgi:Tol biopolymer transport system component